MSVSTADYKRKLLPARTNSPVRLNVSDWATTSVNIPQKLTWAPEGRQTWRSHAEGDTASHTGSTSRHSATKHAGPRGHSPAPSCSYSAALFFLSAQLNHQTRTRIGTGNETRMVQNQKAPPCRTSKLISNFDHLSISYTRRRDAANPIWHLAWGWSHLDRTHLARLDKSSSEPTHRDWRPVALHSLCYVQIHVSGRSLHVFRCPPVHFLFLQLFHIKSLPVSQGAFIWKHLQEVLSVTDSRPKESGSAVTSPTVFILLLGMFFTC